jgi:hypothetical protein
MGFRVTEGDKPEMYGKIGLSIVAANDMNEAGDRVFEGLAEAGVCKATQGRTSGRRMMGTESVEELARMAESIVKNMKIMCQLEDVCQLIAPNKAAAVLLFDKIQASCDAVARCAIDALPDKVLRVMNELSAESRASEDHACLQECGDCGSCKGHDGGDCVVARLSSRLCDAMRLVSESLGLDPKDSNIVFLTDEGKTKARAKDVSEDRPMKEPTSDHPTPPGKPVSGSAASRFEAMYREAFRNKLRRAAGKPSDEKDCDCDE